MVLIVDDDSVAIQLTGLAGTLPEQILLQAWTLRPYEWEYQRRVGTVGCHLEVAVDFFLIQKHLHVIVSVLLSHVGLEEGLA